MEKKLNHLLADFVVEYHKLQTFHWYIRGKDFFIVHSKLEEYYNSLNQAIDQIAEQILMIGYQPIASMKDFLAITTIKEAKQEHLSSKEIYHEVYKDFNHLLSSIKEIKVKADEKQCFQISSLMDDYLSYFTKAIWMLNQVI